MRANIRRLIGLLGSFGLALIIAAPLWAASATYDYDDFGRLIEVLYDDGTRIVYTYDDAGNRLTQVITVFVPPSADLQIAVADSPDPVVQGDNVTYSVTVTNNGPDTANAATLAAALPGNVTLISATPSQGTCDTAVSCSLGAIASSGSATVTVVVSADASGSISYPMTVSATEADPTPANDSFTANTTVNAPPSGDVIVDDLDPNTSQTGTWKVSTDLVSYSGQALFADKTATFRWSPTLPQQGTYAVYAWWVFHNKNSTSVPYEISHAGGTDIVNVNQHDSALEGQWNLLGSYTFNAGSGAWVEVSRPGGRVYADAVRFVQAGGAPSADIAVAMTDAPDPVTEGSNITYTATVTNNGPSGATNVTLTDILPASLSLVSATPSQGSCSGDPNISCALGTLASSANATVTIVATATSAGSVNNTASASATEADPQASNDSATASTTVNAPGPSADLSVAVADSPDPVTEGNNVTYSVTVTNNGPDTANAATLAATLPGNVTYVSAVPSQGSCDTAVSCSLGAIASLGTATVTIEVSADAAGTISYPMSVSATESDPNGGNNSDTETTTVDSLPGGDIVVDNLDAGGTAIGSWNPSTDAASYAGQSLWSKKANARFEWHFTIATTGSYEVYAWWVDRAQITSTAPYTIHHAGGSNVVTVDQSPAALEGQWNLLGTYSFNAGTSHFVEIDTTNGLVSADAVKLVAQ